MRTAPYRQQHGGALLITLCTLAALACMTAYAFQRVSPKFQSAHQTAAWQEARVAAEAGIDAAMGDLVRNTAGSAQGPWTGWKKGNGEPAGNLITDLLDPITSLLATLLGGGGSRPPPPAEPIFLDNVNISSVSGNLTEVDVQLWALRPTDSRQFWFRIRSMATSALPPSAYRVAEKLDVPLRRLSLREVRPQLRRDDVGNPMGVPTPNASRVVEVLVEPILPFELALWTDESMRLANTGTWTVDSYDSRYADTSTSRGTYPGAASPKVQENGHVASNQGRPPESLYGPLITANGARVRGVVATNGGDDPATETHENIFAATALNPERIRDDFFREMRPLTRPTGGDAWEAPLFGLPFVAGPETTPSQYLVTGTLDSLNIDARPTNSRRAVIIMVNGDVDLREDIIIPPNVTALLYVRGNIDFHHYRVNSDGDSSNRPAQLQIYGEGTRLDRRLVRADGNASICAAFYGPAHEVRLYDSVEWCGAIAARSFEMLGGGTGGIHYDEALSQVGPPIGYRIARYIEDVRQ